MVKRYLLTPLYLLVAILNCVYSDEIFASQYNIIFMLSDDQDWAGLSVSMDPRDPNSKSKYNETPSLEALAAEGTRFTRAYAPSPVCSPTRASIQTGKTPARLNWTKAEPFFSEDDRQYLIPPTHTKNLQSSEITIGEMLQRVNYSTAHFGKWHLLGGGPEKHGYDQSDGDIGNKYAADFVDPNPVDLFGMIDRAERFIAKAHNDNKPFFLQLSFHALHYPENALEVTIKKYKNKFGNQIDVRNIQRLAINENMDTAIGRLLAFIQDKKLEDSTYIVFMADNGATNRSSSLRGGKGALWEGGIRVPFIIKGPGIPENAINDTPILGYDLFPTFMTLAGIDEHPPNLDGIDILKFLENGHSQHERPAKGLVFHFPHYQKKQEPASALIVNNWKVIKNYGQTSDVLINLESDSSERVNLIEKKPEIYKRLLLQLENYLLSVNAALPKKNPKFDPKADLKPKKRAKR